MASVLRYRYGPKNDLVIEKTGTVAIEMGDMVMLVGSNGRIQAVSAAANHTALIGVAMTASPTTDPTATKIHVLHVGVGTVFEMKLSAAGKLSFGQPFTINAVQTLATKGNASTNLASSATNVVAICAKTMDATASVCLVRFVGTKWDVVGS